MGLIRTDATQARIEWDRRRRMPRRIFSGGRGMNVVALAGRREEVSAFRPDRGPRVTYLLETDRGQASLVFDLRRRAWYLESLDEAA